MPCLLIALRILKAALLFKSKLRNGFFFKKLSSLHTYISELCFVKYILAPVREDMFINMEMS